MTSTVQDMMRLTEAAEWIERTRAEGHTRASGRARLDSILADIEKRRGKTETNKLRAEIARQLKGGRNA